MMSEYAQNTILDAVLKAVPYYSKPPYLGLFLTAPERATAQPLGEVATETFVLDPEFETLVTDHDYIRQPVTFAAAKNRRIWNSKPVIFPKPTATWSSKEHPIIAAAIMDEKFGGNFLWTGDTRPRRVLKGYPGPTFNPYSLLLSFQSGDILLSNYMCNGVLDAILRQTTFTIPDNVYMALLTDYPDKAEDSILEIEILPQDDAGRDTGYKRQKITFADAKAGRSLNDDDIIFPVPTADWTERSDKAVVATAIVTEEERSLTTKWLFAKPIDPEYFFMGSVPPKFDAGQINLLLDER